MKIKTKEDAQQYWGQYASKEARMERFERIYTLYIQEGLSLQQIADQFGISKQRVHQILLKEANEPELLAIKRRADIVERNTWRTKEIEYQIEQGLSCSKIAAMLDISVNVVKRVSARYRKAKQTEIR
jgi:DNA-binding CsgD family transcriptional regulator